MNKTRAKAIRKLMMAELEKTGRKDWPYRAKRKLYRLLKRAYLEMVGPASTRWKRFNENFRTLEKDAVILQGT